MKYKELMEKTKDLNLEEIGIYLGEKVDELETICLWKENDEWILRRTFDDGVERYWRGEEEDICNEAACLVVLYTPQELFKTPSFQRLIESIKLHSDPTKKTPVKKPQVNKHPIIGYEELLEKTKDINLTRINVYLGIDMPVSGSTCLWEENGTWHVRRIFRNGRIVQLSGTETKMCWKMYRTILFQDATYERRLEGIRKRMS